MKIFRYMVRGILILIVIGIIGIGEYHIYWKKAEYTKVYSGIVLDSYVSSGRRSSTCFATVRFMNGDIQEVNTGHYLYSVGQKFYGQLTWNPIFGVSGYAYSWNPDERLLFFVMPAALFNIFLCLYIVYSVVIFAFKKG